MKYGIVAILFFLVLNCNTILGQGITASLYETYESYKEPTLGKRRIKHQDLQPLLSKLATNKKFTVKKVGSSIEGRALHLVSIGTGDTHVFLWSQMHGDEPTATQALFDIFNFLGGEGFEREKRDILKQCTLHFLPMLNPDGAERFQRRNLLGVDINRDALHLQSPESQTLKKVRDSLNANFGFNLHDQSTYYNAERTDKPATISYLAPAFNYEKEINSVRANAMKVIVYMNNIIQKYAPGQVGRYNDDFEPRAFGDNIQKWGTSTILIESGGFADDVEKQQIRKLNYVSILSAIHTIAKKDYLQIALEDYEKIPENDRKLFDLKITNAEYEVLGKKYRLDLGINRLEVDREGKKDFWYSSRILDQGDLSTYYGYDNFDAKGYTIQPGRVAPDTLGSIGELDREEALRLLAQGHAYVRFKHIPANLTNFDQPVHILSEQHALPNFTIEVGVNPTFLLEKNGVYEYAVINGFLINLKSGTTNFVNSMVFR